MTQAKTEAAALPEHARAVIVGGGIMGCALAYHLAREGWTETVLLEKGELTSGSTWHAAGQITHSGAHYGLGKCAGYGIRLYQKLEAETGQSVTFHGCGSLRIAYDGDEEDYLRHIFSVASALGFPAEIITSPKQIRKLHPFYNPDGVRAALHTPDDGHLDPAGAAFALAKGARQMGAKVIRRCRVTGIKQKQNGEWLAQTERGDISCEHIINAGGMFARQIAEWCGYALPAASMTHHYLITEKSPEFAELQTELPVIRDDKRLSGYLRTEQNAGLVGIYEKENTNTVWDEGVPWNAENEIFPPHMERIEPWLNAAMERMPVLSKLGIRRIVHGAISHPPDGNPLVGPAPGLQNYWCFCGCQIGIGWGPGLAQELARWIAHGAADISMRDLDPRRFGNYAGGDYRIAKAKEDYSLRHEIPYPRRDRPAARAQRKSPLYERLKEKGAVFEDVCGWERPRWFARGDVPQREMYSFRRTKVDDIVVAEEVRAVRGRAGIIDISAFAKMEVCGEQSAAMLEELIPNRLPKPGRVGLAHFLSRSGRMEVEATVARPEENRFYIACAPFFELRLADILNFAPQTKTNNGGARIINRTDEWSAIAINGPRAREILSECSDANLENESFPPMGAQEITVAGGRMLALRLAYAGELGWELHGVRDAVANAYESLCAAGEKHDIRDYGSFAMNSMRMEKMFPGAGELTNEVTMAEAGVARFARPEKASGENEAPRFRCVYLIVEDDESGADGCGTEAVFAKNGGEKIGVVSSIARGHSCGKLLAFAYVPPQFAEAETQLEILIQGERRAAKVCARPVYDPENKKPKG